MIEQRQLTLGDSVKDALNDAMQRLHVPGVAVGILHDDVEEAASFGVTSIDNPLPVDADTLFQIGSITKTFTATATQRLVEEGRLNLETPLQQYLPRLRLVDPYVSARVTLRHLLTHTAGFIGDDFTDTGRGDDALIRYVEAMATLPQVSPLGALFSYCNAGFNLVGRVLEVTTGQTYEQVVRELVLDPLGMTYSTFEPHETMLRRFVVGHISPYKAGGEIRIASPWALPRASNPAGGLTSSVHELFRYARLHLGQGPSGILSDQSRRTMQAPLAPAGNFADSVGMAWMLRGTGGSSTVEHSGGTNGQQTLFKLLPRHNFALVILTNSSRGAELHGQLARVLLQQYLGLEDAVPTPLQLPADRLLEYVGRYEQALSSVDVRAGDDGGLVVQVTGKGGFPIKDSPPGPPPPAAAFAFWSDDRIIGLDPPSVGSRAEFLRNATGDVVWLRIGGRLAARQ